MSERGGDGAPVLTWRDSAGGPAGLWERLGELGWLPDNPRFVLQVGQRDRSPLLIETVHSLMRFLRASRPQARVEVLDPDGPHADWAGLGVTAISDAESIIVTGIAAPELIIPRLWFESYVLITLASPVACARVRLRGVLDAQADPLRRLGNLPGAAVLAYEAHRLAPSDLAVACGTAALPAAGAGNHWWAVGPSDVAVDCVVGAAAGAPVERLPLVRALARHERLPSPRHLGEALPALDGYLAADSVVWANAVRERITGAAGAVVRDARTVRRNLDKIPGFVRRKLASRTRGAA
jgi:hypothetical protein